MVMAGVILVALGRIFLYALRSTGNLRQESAATSPRKSSPLGGEMDLSRYMTDSGPRWACDAVLLHPSFTLSSLLALPSHEQAAFIDRQSTGKSASDIVSASNQLAPIEPDQEIWASGVTYLRSREAREAESATGDIYQHVYTAPRPELFYKGPGWRTVAPGGTIRVRRDSRWNVPEPELTLVMNSAGEICGYTAGNDVSSRDIEGENPLYLPQAKVYNGSCALGPVIRLVSSSETLRNLPIQLEIQRGGSPLFLGETSTGLMKRGFDELVGYLFRELDFPQGAFLLTGTGIVPPEEYSLMPGDEVRITVGDIMLCNTTG
jgi:2-dehydro-3-deoxy-D-arabinonate dehydratase